MPSSIIHDDVSESHVASSPQLQQQPQPVSRSTSTEEMRFFPRWIGCQRTATPTLSSSSSFVCPSHMNSVRSEWRVEDFEQEVSLYFLAPDLALDLETTLRNQSSSATLTLQQQQSSGTVTPIPRTNINNKNVSLNDINRDRRSSFLKFNLGELFRPPVISTPHNSIGFESDAHLAPTPTRVAAIATASSPSRFPFPSHSQPQNQNHNLNNTNLVSLPSVSSASVSTYASASAFTVASSHPSISTYASASASVAPSSASTSGGRRSRSRSRRSRRTPSHFSSSSCSYSYPYSDYMSSSSSGLSIQDHYLEEDIGAGIDNTTSVEVEPTSPTTTNTTGTTSHTTSVSVSSSSSSPKRSNLVRRLRLRGGADENYLKLKSLNAGISSSGGIFSSSPSPHKSPSRTKSRNGLRDDDDDENDDGEGEDNNHIYPRPNPNAKLKKRFIFVELDEEGHIIDNRRGGSGGGGGKTSSYRIDETTLRQRQVHNTNHNNNNDTIGKTITSPLAMAAEHLSSTLTHNPLFQLRFRKQKRLLVKDIPTDDGEFTRSRIVALRQWAESLGAVRRLMRAIPDGTIWIEFKDREVAENVCHLHAHVHIPNVGRVRLDWVEGREAG